MTAPVVLEHPEEVDEDGEDGGDVCHLYCCDENLSVCGLDISDAPYVDESCQDALDCLFCDAIIKCVVAWRCPRCGREP